MATFVLRTLSVAIMCALGYLGFALYDKQLNWTLEQKASVRAMGWLEFFSKTVPGFGDILRTGVVSPTQLEALRAGKESLDVFRFKLFNTSGELTFVSDVIGGISTGGADLFTHNPEASSVLRSGDVFVALKDGSSTPGRPDTYAEIYLPVIIDQAPAGVVEVYVDMASTREVAQASFTRFAALLGGLALAAMLVPTLHWAAAWRDTRRKNAALQTTATALRETAERQAQLAEEVGLIGGLNEWLQSSRSQGELFEMVSVFLTRLLPNSQGEIYVYSNSRDALVGCTSWGGAEVKAHIHSEDCWGLRRGRTYAYGEERIGFPCNHVEAGQDDRYLCLPLLAHGETIGLLHVRLGGMPTSSERLDARRVAQISAEQISMAIANVRMRDELQDQSIRDSLTGLYNRRHLANALRRSLAMAERRGASVALLSIDVDHFKSFNDTFGHDAGDMVLRKVGEVLDLATDGDELACRPGGEEFMVVLPDTDMADALHRAELIREQIQAISIRYGERTLPGITVSVGIALSPEDGKIPQDLMGAADDALYAAKAEGRNRTVLSKLVGFGGAPERPGMPGAADATRNPTTPVEDKSGAAEATVEVSSRIRTQTSSQEGTSAGGDQSIARPSETGALAGRA